MDERAIIKAGTLDLDCVRQFLQWFPDAEHTVVQAKRENHGEGWGLVSEWISRARMYDRYVFWLVVAIDVNDYGSVTATELPQLSLIQINEIERTRIDLRGPKWKLGFGQFDDEDWQELVESGGDFDSVGLELITDQPVERFETFWNDTRPHHIPPAHNAMALKAPLRFLE